MSSLPSAPVDDFVGWFAGRRDLDGVVFPVLVFKTDEGVGPCRDEAALRKCTLYSLEQGDVEGMEILDAAEQAFTVRSATPELDLGPTGITRWVAVSFDLTPPRPLPFAELRETLALHGGSIQRHAEDVRRQGTFRDLYILVVKLQP